MTQEEIKEYVYGKSNKTNYFYYVVVTEQDGKYFARAERVSESNNLLSVISRWLNCFIIHQCKSFKHAQDLAYNWNISYKKNGTYLYGKEPIYR